MELTLAWKALRACSVTHTVAAIQALILRDSFQAVSME